MRNLIYYVACTVDGFIAHPDGSFDGFPWDDDVVADFFASYDWFDTVLMGRKTYDVGVDAGKTDPYAHLKSYVFSRTMPESLNPKVTLISEEAIEEVRALKAQPGKPIWLCGGADLAATLFEAGLIDEIILKLNPVLFGSGIPLFARSIPVTALTLNKHKVYDGGTVLLHYAVNGV